jgi:hypothetical protein
VEFQVAIDDNFGLKEGLALAWFMVVAIAGGVSVAYLLRRGRDR